MWGLYEGRMVLVEKVGERAEVKWEGDRKLCWWTAKEKAYSRDYFFSNR